MSTPYIAKNFMAEFRRSGLVILASKLLSHLASLSSSQFCFRLIVMAQNALLPSHSLPLRLRSQRCYRSGRNPPCLGRSRLLRVRASDDAERSQPEVQPQQSEPGLSGRRLLLLAGASAVTSAIPMWLSLAKNRGRARAATLADDQVSRML